MDSCLSKFVSIQLNVIKSCGEGWTQIFKDSNIMMLGILQTVIESCMYIFVFLWTPVLSSADPPYGMVFAAFMVSKGSIKSITLFLEVKV